MKLFLNDELIAEQTPDKTIWAPHGAGNHKEHPKNGQGTTISSASLEHPPFTFKSSKLSPGTGELKAVGVLNGKEEVIDTRKVIKAPTKIALTPENESPVLLDGSDAKLVWISIQDDQNTIALSQQVPVNLKISGPGIIVGPKTITTKDGQIAVWVKSKRGTGDITLEATSPGLYKGKLTLKTEEVLGLPEVPVGGDADEYLFHNALQKGNIFLNKKVSASSENTNSKEFAKQAMDGNDNTKWCASSGSYPQWIQVDLGEEYQLDHIALSFELAENPMKFTISVSDEENNWNSSKVVVDYSKNIDKKDLSFPVDCKGRYVRVTLTEQTDNLWAVIREISASGRTTNIALNKPTKGSSNADATNSNMANNGNEATSWKASSNQQEGSYWWQVDLEETFRISRIEALWGRSDVPYKFLVQTSMDGVNFRTIKDLTKG